MEDDSLFDILLSLRHTEEAVRLKAIRKLHGYVNSAEVEYLEEPYTRAEEWQAFTRARTRRLQQRPIKQALMAAIEDSCGDVRFEAAHMLRDTGDTDAHEAVIRHLKTDTYPKVRWMCTSILRDDSHEEFRQDAIIAALQDSSDFVVTKACCDLAIVDSADAVEPLRAVLEHPHWKVRFNACGTLIKLGAIDKTVVEVLEQLNQQPQAVEYNDIARNVNERVAASNLLKDTKLKTTQEVLDEARMALSQ